MRFRMGFAMGFCAGYVLGTKAGRERYEQIKALTSSVMGSPQVEKLRVQAEHGIERAATKLPDSVQERLPESIRIRREPRSDLTPPQEPFGAAHAGDGRRGSL